MREWALVAIIRFGLCPEDSRPGGSIDPTTGTHLNEFRSCLRAGESKAEGLLSIRSRCPEFTRQCLGVSLPETPIFLPFLHPIALLLSSALSFIWIGKGKPHRLNF